MEASNIPAKFTATWASGAATAYVNTIPVPSQQGITNGKASFTDGFPPNCFIAIAAGGSWPFGADFNGILADITSWNQYAQAGGQIAYDAAFSAAIGGYPLGAVVASVTTVGISWRSTIDNNTSNPDTGGAGWTHTGSGRLLNIQTFTSSGTYTPTAGTTSVLIEVVGGGGAGGGSAATAGTSISAAPGGGAGGYARKRLLSGFTGGIAVAVGAGGAAVNAGSGLNGGNSSFGSPTPIVATGGGGGVLGPAETNTQTGVFGVGIGGNGSGGDINAKGGFGSYAVLEVGSAISGPGGASYFGAGAVWATGSLTPGGFANGGPATSPGAGGAGSVCNTSVSGGAIGGAGAAGLVIVWEYA